MMTLLMRWTCGAFVMVLLMFCAAASADAQGEFASTTVDLGVVVSQLDKSVKFYVDAIGFKEGPGFSVPADFCADAGLTDKQALNIRVLSLGDSPAATKLKLMEVPAVSSKKSDNAFVHSQLGYRYITIHVTDTAAAVARLKKAGVKPIAKGPVPLPAGLPAGMALTVVRDPDGNLVELVGPKP
jgi:lactoylglutathione lyase